MNVVVNGASGYIGYHLVSELLKKNHKVFAVCRSNKGLLDKISNSNDLYIIISQQTDIENKLINKNIDVWYQLAWDGSLGEKRADPEIQIENIRLSVEAMVLANKIGCQKILYTGTVYEKLFDCIMDSAKFDKNSFYIFAKKQAHEMTFQLSKKLEIEYVWCQFCHPIGKYMNENQLIPYAINKFINNQTAEFGECSYFFDIIPVEYLVKSMILLGEAKCKKNSYYIGSGNPRVLKEYICELALLCKYRSDIEFGKREDDGMIFQKSYYDTSDFINEFNFNNTYSFEYIINNIKRNDDK